MASTIDQYREAKSTFLKLREQAKKDLLSRFDALSEELFQIQKELKEDFGHKIAIPTKPKPGRVRKKTAPVASKPAAATAPAKSTAPTVSNSKTAAIEKRIAAHKRKMEEAEKAGKLSQVLKDKMYELEDDLRLAREGS